jgi:hypothetical protein
MLVVLLAVLAAAFVALTLSGASAAKGPPAGGGGPPANPGGGGGGKPDKGDLYSDLVPLLRSVDGLPLMVSFGTEQCLQPVSYTAIPGLTSVVNPVDGEQVWKVPLVGELPTVPAEEEEEVEVCDPQPLYTDYLVEVEFGRLNMGRSPEDVLDARLLEAIAALTGSDEPVTLDHAGRLVYVEGGVEFTIDAPLENLAIHETLQETGALETLVLPTPFAGYGILDHAAAMLGGAADKGGRIVPDTVVYFNAILDTPSETTFTGLLPVLEGDGVVGVDGVTYANYRAYSYDRAATFPGCIMGVENVGTTNDWFKAPIMERVFNGVPFTGSNVEAFAQHADDARKVGAYAHDAIDYAVYITAIDDVGETDVCAMEVPAG